MREGFFFIEEDMVEEDGKYYPMMKVKPPKSGEESRQNEEVWKIEQLWFGKLLLEKRHPVLKRYLERETRIREEILRSIRDKDSEQIQVRRGQLQEELNIIKKGMEYYAL